MTRHSSRTVVVRTVLVWAVMTTMLAAEELSFRRHDVNPESAYSACAAIDVDRDGKLDIVCGGFWYQAPSWKRHFLREVRMIRGRYDGYSHLPMDVNGDGWTDCVNVNYRSSSLFWVENPAREPGPWTKHVIDTPGPMETGRLADVDGDGRLDILPNGVKFAGWWELQQRNIGDNEVQHQWIRHHLPAEVAGHGVGFGDINGDGRGDVVGPRGWLEAPKDRRRERWIWHPQFDLPRDCSVPMLVYDVDADGDGDVVYGRAHHTGLYWLEQQTDLEGGRRWVRHAIDTSWSQPHSLLLVDIDGDDQPELVAGKRYMGHDGRDPGEYDPLAVYWYKFDKQRNTWRRHTISQGGGVGFGLDPKAADIDADGDLDLIVCGRSGLYWLENLLIGDDRPAPTRSRPAPSYDDHSQLLVYLDDQGGQHNVESPDDWALRRSHIMAGMQEAMGRLPPPHQRVPLDVKLIESSQLPEFVRRKITFAVEPNDRVPAYLLIPNALTSKARAMLCLHQTTRIGKGEPAGLGGRETLHYAQELAERGYVCLVPDYPSFGDYEYDFRSQGAHYASGSMKAIWNNIRAVDLLESMAEVDGDRIGCIGHSLGGHNALFTAVFEQRIKAVVTSCGFTAFHHYFGGKLKGWTSDRYMPRIRERYDANPDRVPFDFYEVLAAIAPRAIFVNAPLHDHNFDVTGVKKVMAGVEPVYDLLGAQGRLRAEYPDSSHDFPDEVRRQAYQWLDSQLQ